MNFERQPLRAFADRYPSTYEEAVHELRLEASPDARIERLIDEYCAFEVERKTE